MGYTGYTQDPGKSGSIQKNKELHSYPLVIHPGWRISKFSAFIPLSLDLFPVYQIYHCFQQFLSLNFFLLKNNTFFQILSRPILDPKKNTMVGWLA